MNAHALESIVVAVVVAAAAWQALGQLAPRARAGILARLAKALDRGALAPAAARLRRLLPSPQAGSGGSCGSGCSSCGTCAPSPKPRVATITVHRRGDGR